MAGRALLYDALGTLVALLAALLLRPDHAWMVAGQYPYLEPGSSLTYGQCAVSADCAIYVVLYPTQPASYFVCNQQVGRCQTLDGAIVGPAFPATCPGIAIHSMDYPSLDAYASRVDGIAVLNVSSTPTTQVTGDLRVYAGVLPAPASNNTLAVPYVDGRYVTARNQATFFRGLAPGTYTAVYFAESGCTVYSTPFVVPEAMDGSYFPVTSCNTNGCAGAGVVWNDATGFLNLTAFAHTDPAAAFGVGWRGGLGAPWTAAYMHTGSADAGVGQRVPFAQIMDISGGVLATFVGTDLLWPIPPAAPTPAALGGVTYPLGAGNVSGIVTDAGVATLFAGVVSVVVGIGYGFRSAPGAPLIMLQTNDGKLEGALMAPFVLDLAGSTIPNTFAPPAGTPFPPYDVGPQKYRLQGAYTNTAFMYQVSNIFAGATANSTNATLLANYPEVVIVNAGTNQTVNANSLCLNGSVTYANVYLDYSQYPFKFNPVVLEIMQVVYSPLGAYLVSQSPPSTEVIVAQETVLPVYVPGLYCAVLTDTLADGYGPRPLLHTCFQVGVPTAGMTMARSSVVPPPAGQYPYTPYAGLATQIVTSFVVGLPATLVLPPQLVMLAAVHQFSRDPAQQTQINEAGTNYIDVVGTAAIGYFAMENYYTESTYGPFTLYTLGVSPYARAHQFVASYAALGSVTQSVAVARLSFIDTAAAPPLPPVPPPGRRGDRAEPVRARRAETPSAVPPLPSPSLTPRPVIDYTTPGPEPLPVGESVQMTCAVATDVRLAQYTPLSVSVTGDVAICPDAQSLMRAAGTGGFPFAATTPGLVNPIYTGPGGASQGSSPPFTNPVAYDFSWVDMDTGVKLLSGEGQASFAAVQNQRINVTITDAMGQTAWTVVVATSIYPPSAETIAFQPQVPFCVGGAQQWTQMPFTLSNRNASNVLVVQPTDVQNNELYDPNSLAFDRPGDCALLQNYTAYQVYAGCVLGAPAPFNTSLCGGCTRLPIAYPQVSGQTITTVNNNEQWTVVVWFITPYVNDVTGLNVYCQVQNGTRSVVPQPLGLTFGQPTRIPGPPTGPTCLSQNCIQVSIGAVLDPCFTNPALACYQFGAPNYAAQVLLLSSPPLAPLGGGLYRVSLTQEYSIVAVIGNVTFCPVTIDYTPSLLGPLVFEVQTTPASCAAGGPNAADASVNIVMNYNNPAPGVAGTTAPLCLYWPDRHAPQYAAADAVPLAFSVTVNAPTSTILPNGQFGGDTQRFNGIRPGPSAFGIYDRCPDNTCTSCYNTATFTPTNAGLAFTYVQFTVPTFDNGAGGIAISLDGYAPAQCFNDTYYWNFSFVDTANPNTGLATQNYQVVFTDPLGGVITQWSSCGPGGRSIQGDATPYGEFQVQWGPFEAVLPTGGVRGLGISGTYAFSVTGCTTLCTESYPIPINIVTPLIINTGTAGSLCANTPAQANLQVQGGAPIGECTNASLVYQYPGNSIIYCMPYRVYYKTPLNPDNFTEIILPELVQPGPYVVKVVDANNCPAEQAYVIGAPEPITASIVDYNGVCQVSNQSVVYILLQGGTPPYLLLENVTDITYSDRVNATFVAQFNASRCFHVLDASGCLSPTRVCFVVPNPGPVNVSIVVEDSCPTVATGSVRAVSDEDITCEWSVTGGTTPLIQSCVLTGLPPSAQLVVKATTIIGCVGTALARVGTRPPIVMTLTDRTTNGVPNGPCIDTITATIAGGSLGPPYQVSLFHDATGANISITYTTLPPCPPNVTNATGPCVPSNSTGNITGGIITVTGVCRSYVYTIVAREHDGLCTTTLVVTDPQFSFGSTTPGSTLMGFGALNSLLPLPRNPYFEPYVAHGPTWSTTWLLAVVVAAAGAIGIMTAFARVDS